MQSWVRGYWVPRVVFVQFTRPPYDPCVVAPWSKGDVDGNGKLEEGDYQLLQKYLRERGAL